MQYVFLFVDFESHVSVMAHWYQDIIYGYILYFLFKAT